MSNVWLKIVGLVVVIVVAVVLVNVFSPSEPESVNEPSEEPPSGTEVRDVNSARDESRLEMDRRRAERQRRLRQPLESDRSQTAEVIEDIEVNIQAEKLYQMALLHYKLGRKPGMTFKKAVDYCRRILTEYPQTEYALQASELLRKIPERHRQMYNVTDEEMGL